MATVSQGYKDIIYGGGLTNLAKISFGGIEVVDVDETLEKITFKSRTMNNGATTFALDDFVSQEVDIAIRNLPLESIINPVEVHLGTLVGGSYEWVKKGVYDIQNTPTTDNGKTTIKLRDYSKRFDVPYNAKPLIDLSPNEPKTTTLRAILDDIGIKCDVVIDVPTFPNEDMEIGIYDNTIKAWQYVKWIAGQGGMKPIIDNNGVLKFININSLTTWTIPINVIEKYKVGTPYEISEVVYEDGVRRYESGDDSKDTLYIDTNNVYISNQGQIDNILTKVDNFKIDSIVFGKVLGNPAIDAWDLVEFTDEGKTYRTLANNTLVYNGVFTQEFDTEIGEKAREQNVTLNGEATFKKWAKTEIDNIDGRVTIVAGEIGAITPSVNKSVKSTKVQYYLSTSNVSPTGSSWSDTAPEWEEDKYMFTRTTTTLNDNTVVYSPSANGTLLEGLKGKDGESGTSSYTYIRYSKNADGTGFTSTPQVDTEYIGIAVTSSAIAPTLKGDYTWSKYVGQDGTSGEDGASIWSTTVAPVTPNYTFTKTNLTGPVGVDIKSGDIILYSYYRYTITTISSTTVLAPTRVSIRGATGAAGTNGTNGEDGRGITNSTITYQLHTNGTTAPTGSWLSNPPTPEQGKYLWTKTVLTYTDSSNSTTYSVSYYATDGQNGTNGKGISTTEIKYQIHTSGTTAPTGTWLDNPPTPEKGKYLWTRTKITYTDATNSTTYSVSYYATDGQKGDTGTGIVSITAQYYKSTSNSTQTGGSWSTTPPTYEKNKYLWFRNEIVYKNPTSTEYTTPQLDTTWEEIGAVETRTASLEVRTDAIEGNVEDLIDLTDFVKTASGTTTNLQIPNTPKSNGAINTLSIKKIPFMELYPGMAYPSETTYPGALTFYTLVFDTTASFNNTPAYVYINSPIALRTLGSTYDELLIENNKVKIIQRVSLNGSSALGTPITHNLGDVILPTFDGTTYVKLLYFTNLIWNATYITKNDYSEVFATQLESASQFLMNSKQVVLKVKSDGEVAGLELGAGQEGEGSSFKVKAKNINLEGYTTINDGFSVDEEGNATMNNAEIKGSILKLADNTEIVGGNGILTNLEFTSDFKALGFWQISLEGLALEFGFLTINAFIPNNFIIREAIITLNVYKTSNEFQLPQTYSTTSIIGKANNIRGYKTTTSSIFTNSTEFGTFVYDPPIGTEIPNCFGASGYTNTTGETHITTSNDIKTSLTAGPNQIIIKTGNAEPDQNTDAGVTSAGQQTQFATASLTIIGWLK